MDALTTTLAFEIGLLAAAGLLGFAFQLPLRRAR